MKGTISEGIVEKLFRGKVYNYIKCINVDYESSRVETFYGKLHSVVLNPADIILLKSEVNERPPNKFLHSIFYFVTQISHWM